MTSPTFDTEAEFDKAVNKLASEFGWFSMRITKANIRGRPITATVIAGFDWKVTAWPDRVFWSERGGLLFRELKLDDGRFKPNQELVLETLQTAGADAAVWRPRDWDTDIVPTLTHQRKATA